MKAVDLELALADPVIKQIPLSSSPGDEDWHLNFSSIIWGLWISLFYTEKGVCHLLSIFVNIHLGGRDVSKNWDIVFGSIRHCLIKDLEGVVKIHLVFWQSCKWSSTGMHQSTDQTLVRKLLHRRQALLMDPGLAQHWIWHVFMFSR